MLSGVKFISRDQLGKSQDKEREKQRRKKKSLRNDDSDDDLERIGKGSKRKKKWYSSNEDSSPSSSGTEDSYERNGKRRSGKKEKKRLKSGKKRHLSEEYSSSYSEDEDGKDRRKGGKKLVKEGDEDIGSDVSGDGKRVDIARQEMRLDWMLRPVQQTKKSPVVVEPDEPPLEGVKKVNPRELNPYLKDNGSGYPDEADENRAGGDQLASSSLVGDGGASWRLKALKRAQEQAAREGRKLEEVVEERWGSLGQLAVSVASSKAAPARAHLHAIRNRQRESAISDEPQTLTNDQTERNLDKNTSRSYLKDVSVRHPEMKAPKVLDSLSWGKRKTQTRSREDENLISAAVSSLNKFANDGSFMGKLLGNELDNNVVSSQLEKEDIANSMSTSRQVDEPNEASALAKQALSANQLAAKALQLRMKGKHDEAEKLLQEAEKMKASQDAGHNSGGPQKTGSTSSHVIQDYSSRKKEEDADRHLAGKIIQNKQYSLSGRADDEYDFEDGPSRKSKKKGRGGDQKVSVNSSVAKRILTQQERCLFCFENPNRPKHLVVSIANFTYLMLPQWQPIVQGHCCILPMQHESSTRTVEINVWEEIRNFKKCLIMMFANQDKDLVFLETVMGLAQQRHHCLIECIPLPREIAKQAPLYFKKAIDEAEDEWSQHNAKKLIDTSEKGLRGSIPKDFPYFHVEFGLNRGYVHVIDDEKQFNASLGLNVIRGMLRLPEEDMYRRRRHESTDAQRQAVAEFAQDWEAFDWTKQLD